MPEGLAQPIVDAMAKVITENDISYALFGGGLLGFEIGAGLTARLGAGVTMEVTAVKVDGGKLIAERPVLQDSAVVDVGYVSEPGVIIGRLNAFDANESGSGDAEVIDIDVELSEFSSRATMVTRGEPATPAESTSPTPTSWSAAAAASAARRTSPSPATWRPRSAARLPRRARSSTPAGFPTRPRSARRARPSRRSCTSRPASPARSSTRSA